ncbi:hypothetical protein ACPA9J_03630 [Pseudomonas aeruginosa]
MSSTATTATLALGRADARLASTGSGGGGARRAAMVCAPWRLSSPSQPPASAGTRWSSSWPWPWLAVFWGRSWRRGRPPTTCRTCSGSPLQLRSALQFAAFLAAVMLARRFFADHASEMLASC